MEGICIHPIMLAKYLKDGQSLFLEFILSCIAFMSEFENNPFTGLIYNKEKSTSSPFILSQLQYSA